MSINYTTRYQLDIYTAASCFRGESNQANPRRVSDILNDRAHSFLELEKAYLVLWDDGTPQQVDCIGTIAVVKRNVIAVIVGNVAQVGTNSSHLYRVDKSPSRVALYTPSVEVTGNIHLLKGAELLNVLDSTQVDFLPVTSAAMRWLDRRAPLPNSAGLIFINRNQISAIRSMPPSGSNTELIDPAIILQAAPATARLPANV